MSRIDPKKFLLLLAIMSWIVIEGCNARPITVSQGDMEAVFSVGSTFRLLWDSTSQPVNVGDTGGPHIYDFSHLSFVPYDSITMLAVAQVPQLAPRYPPHALTSNEEGNTVYPVFSFSNHAFYRDGRARIVADTEWYQHIVPPDEWLKFPLQFNTEYGQTSAVTVDTTYVNGILFRTSADTSSVTKYIDGYGTLLLPGGLAFQCLRMRLVAWSPKTSKEFHFWTREGAVILIGSDQSQPDTGVVKREYVIYFSPQARDQNTRD